MENERPPDFSGGLRVSYTRSPIRWCCRGGFLRWSNGSIGLDQLLESRRLVGRCCLERMGLQRRRNGS